MRFPLLVAWSHLRSRRQDVGVNLIAVLSVLGVTLGVQMLIIVLSVMNGFEIELRNKILGNNAHFVALAYGGPLEEPERALATVEKGEGVEAAAPFVYTEVMVRSSFATAGGILKGVDPERSLKVTDIASVLRVGPEGALGGPDAAAQVVRSLHTPARASGQAPDDTDALPGIIVGKGLAETLKVYPGDRLFVINPIGGGVGAFGVPMPTTRAFRVTGIFDMGMYEFDTKWTYVALEDAQDFLGFTKGEVTGLEVRVAPDRIEDVEAVAAPVEEALGFPYFARTWLDLNESLFAAMKLEKYVMGLILAQIITVAAVGIVTNLVVMVITRGREISILRAMGASRAQVRRIFVLEGMIVGVVGTLLGTGLGLAGCWALQTWKFPLDTNVYFLDSLPVVVEPPLVVAVALGALLICFVATIYPSRRAAALDPVEGLRYE
jgi:lipoprotein-releasing system permease protein